MSKLRLFFLIILIQVVFFSCETDNPVPETYVNFIVNLDIPLYSALNSPGNSIVFPNEGYKDRGVIITRIIDNFIAYDATCTYDPEDPWGKVEIDETNVFALDKNCNSKFSLLQDGIPVEGPASIPLKIYTVDYNPNMNTITVHN